MGNFVKVLYDFSYKTSAGVQVDLVQGDEYKLLKKSNEDWWQVIKEGAQKSLYVPANYVEEIVGNLLKVDKNSNTRDSLNHEVNCSTFKDLADVVYENLPESDKNTDDDPLQNDSSVKSSSEDPLQNDSSVKSSSDSLDSNKSFETRASTLPRMKPALSIKPPMLKIKDSNIEKESKVRYF